MAKKRKKGMGKSKGSQFERDVCRSLSLHVSRGKRDDLFWRSAGSGNSATMAMKKGQKKDAQIGDVVSVHPGGAAFMRCFAVECKFYRDLGLHHLWNGRASSCIPFKAFIDLRDQLTGSERHPVVVAKQNNGRVLLFTDPAGAFIFTYASERPKFTFQIDVNGVVMIGLYFEEAMASPPAPAIVAKRKDLRQ